MADYIYNRLALIMGIPDPTSREQKLIPVLCKETV